MPINTGISNGFRQPKVYHRLTFIRGGGALAELPLLLLLIGQAKGGNAVAGSIYEVTATEESASLFGVGTSLDLMCRKAFATITRIGQGPRVYALGLDEPGGGTANTQTATFATNATTSGLHTFRVAGRTYAIAVAALDTPTIQAAALAAAVNADPTSPVTAAAAVGVVTFTHRTKGVNGKDVLIERVPLPTQPGGTTVVIANAANGAGVSSIVAALAASAGVDFDVIAIDNHAAQDVTDSKSHVLDMWTATAKKWRRVVIGETGTVGTITSLASTADEKALSFFGVPKARSLPGELAAAFGVALLSQNRPNVNLDGRSLPLDGPDFADVLTDGQIETLLGIGVSPGISATNNLTRTADSSTIRIVKAVTAAQTLNGYTSEVLRDVAVPNVAAYIARQVDRGWADKMGADSNPDAALDDDLSVEKTRLMIENILTDAAERSIVKQLPLLIAALHVESDISGTGRINADITTKPVTGAHQLAVVQRVTVGG